MKKLALLVLVLAACRDRAGLPALGEGPTDWYEPGDAAHFAAHLASSGPALEFRRHFPGTWAFDYDTRLGTPWRIAGTSDEAFVLGNVRDAIGSAELVVLGNQALLGREWDYDGHVHHGDLWTVQFRQKMNGLPVVGGHVGVTFNRGRLVLVQGRIFPVVDPDLNIVATHDVASAFAAVDKAFAAAPHGAGDVADLVVYPQRLPGTVAYRVAWEVTSRRRDLDVVAYVDAHTNELVHAYDLRAYDAGAAGAYPGAITNDVDARTVGDDVLSEPGAFQHAQAGGVTVTSNEHGVFRFPSSVRNKENGAPVAVNAAMRGPYADVRNMRGAGATYAGTIRPGQPVVVSWHDGNSRADERDTFRGTNVTNRFVATIFPDLAWINRPLVANVNHSWTCNAYWDGKTINFFREDNQCNNSGRIFDVIAHEWGHGLDQNAPGGVQDRALGEFIGDLVSFVQTRDAKLGPGFFVEGGAVRDLEDPKFYCYDPKKTEVHDAGQYLGVIVWDIYKDLRKLGLDGEELKRLMVLPIAIGQTRSQWYSAMLAVDDDDGNLANGTPHECLIHDRFEEHSCKGTRYPGIPAKRPSHCPKK
jgi:hypothetical protein